MYKQGQLRSEELMPLTRNSDIQHYRQPDVLFNQDPVKVTVSSSRVLVILLTVLCS